MTKFVYSHFYGLPLERVIWLMLFGIIIWAAVEWFVKKKLNLPLLWKIVNGIIFISIVSIIIILTVVSRKNSVEVMLIPFYSLIEAKQSPDIYRSIVMNVFLFYPIGLTLPFFLPNRFRRKSLFAILFALLLSASVEWTQYYFQLGRAETDDVIFNTLGTAIGTLSYSISRKLHMVIKQKKDCG